jgi:DNA-binding CsgD family transcriptional regulator
MAAPTPLSEAHAAYRDRSWRTAYDRYSEAHRAGGLDLPDQEHLATAAYLAGEEDAALDAWVHAHQAYLEEGDSPGAARCAYWAGFALSTRGERARAGGWFARALRVLEEWDGDSVEAGYLLIPQAIRAAGEGDGPRALECFTRAEETGERFGDRDLATLGRHGRGRVLIRMGRAAEGVALLDEVMVAVTADELSPIVAGDVYCSVLEACEERFDPGRAREWTRAMTGWLEAQPELVPFRGQCLVRRAQVFHFCGDWEEALEEARRASDWLTRPPARPAAGDAFYQQAELHRLRGDHERAEEAYREASRWGRKPEPGLPLLRLAQGRTQAAASAIRRALDEARGPIARARLLPAQVRIHLAAGQEDEAGPAARELAELARALDAAPLRAEAAAAEGAVLLHRGKAEEALLPLRQAVEAWTALECPYRAAVVRVLAARACDALGDREAAGLELEVAREVFRALGAAPDLARVEALSRTGAAGAAAATPAGLTPRQVQVLRLVATGRTNRHIARELFISERTVERHVSDIFRKLGVSSRSAATAWAHRHGLA